MISYALGTFTSFMRNSPQYQQQLVAWIGPGTSYLGMSMIDVNEIAKFVALVITVGCSVTIAINSKKDK